MATAKEKKNKKKTVIVTKREASTSTKTKTTFTENFALCLVKYERCHSRFLNMGELLLKMFMISNMIG